MMVCLNDQPESRETFKRDTVDMVLGATKGTGGVFSQQKSDTLRLHCGRETSIDDYLCRPKKKKKCVNDKNRLLKPVSNFIYKIPFALWSRVKWQLEFRYLEAFSMKIAKCIYKKRFLIM